MIDAKPFRILERFIARFIIPTAVTDEAKQLVETNS
jgi:hypothetical protein